MKRFLTFAVGLLALATAAVAQQPGDNRPRGEGRRGEGRPDQPKQPPLPPVVAPSRPLPPVIAPSRPQPPIIAPQRPLPPPVVRPADRPGWGRRPVGPPIVFVPAPSYPRWTRSFGYEERYHDSCQRKAWRLRWFERRAAADGVFTASERGELRSLRRDLRNSCGNFRWRD